MLANTKWSINTLLFPLGIFLFRNGYAYYQSLRSTYHLRAPSIRPPSPQISRALNILFVVALLALISTIPYFSPSNIFRETDGRLQTANDVLFHRLEALRPLTPLDVALKTKLTSKDARLYYFALGPQVVAECPFCSPDDASSYIYYALPTILTPHILHIIVLGIVTSSFLTGYEGARWRTQATIAGVALAAGELYLTLTYDIRANTRSTGTQNIDFFFWKTRVWRGLAIASIDALLGWVMWLAATNRFFLTPPTVAQRLETIAKGVEQSNFRLWASGNVRNTTVRDRDLREKVARYWNAEKGLYEEREVIDAIKSALTRIDMAKLADVADQRAGDVINALMPREELGNGQPP